MTAPRRCGSGKPARPARSRPFPPTRQGVPASRLPAVEDRGGGTALRGRGAWQAWFLAFSPRFLSRTGRGMGPSTNLLPRERGQEVASLSTPVLPLCLTVLIAVHDLLVLTSGYEAPHLLHEEAERRNGKPHNAARFQPHDVSLLTPSHDEKTEASKNEVTTQGHYKNITTNKIKCLLHTGHCATNTLRICHH